jgi:hypothetical protein
MRVHVYVHGTVSQSTSFICCYFIRAGGCVNFNETEQLALFQARTLSARDV